MSRPRTQVLPFALAAFTIVTVSAAGCRPREAGDRPRGAGPSAAAAPTAAVVASKPDDGTASVPVDADARVQLAALRRNAIAKREGEVAVVLGRLKKALDGIDRTGGNSRIETASAEFQKVVKLQRQAATEVVTGYADFQKAIDGYRRELSRAPEAYRQAALYYRERAEVEPNDLLRANYVKLAELADAYGRRVGPRQTELESFLAAAGETVRYVEALARFLKDLDEFFQLSPGAEATAARTQFREQLKGFAKSYAATQSRFEEFHQKLKQQAFSDDLTGDPPPATGAGGRTGADLERVRGDYRRYATELDSRVQSWPHVKRAREAQPGVPAYTVNDTARHDYILVNYEVPAVTWAGPAGGTFRCPKGLVTGELLPLITGSHQLAGVVVVRSSTPGLVYEVELVDGTPDPAAQHWVVVRRDAPRVGYRVR